VTSDGHGDIRLWSAIDGKQVGRFSGPTWGAFSVRLFSNGRQLLLGGDQPSKTAGGAVGGLVQWIDFASGKQIREHVLPGRARQVCPSPDQSLVAVAIDQAGDDGFAASQPLLVVLAADSGNELIRIEMRGTPIAIDWSANGKQILCCDHQALVVVDVVAGKAVLRAELPHSHRNGKGEVQQGGPSQAVFSPRGSTLITASANSELHGWSKFTGQKLWTIPVEGPYFRALALSPDESIVVCLVHEDDKKPRQLRLIDIASQRELGHYDLGMDGVNCLAFSPDGGKVVVGFDDGNAVVYDVSAAVAKQ
jgi:WD40 repeat protein